MRQSVPQNTRESRGEKRKSFSVKQADGDSYTEKFRKTFFRGLFYLKPIPYKMFAYYTE
jgi:hypothetical protein